MGLGSWKAGDIRGVFRIPLPSLGGSNPPFIVLVIPWCIPDKTSSELHANLDGFDIF